MKNTFKISKTSTEFIVPKMGTLAVLYTNMAICAGFSGVAETFILDVAICHYMFSYKITSIISEQTCMH